MFSFGDAIRRVSVDLLFVDSQEMCRPNAILLPVPIA